MGFSAMKTGLDEIAARIQANQQRIIRAGQLCDQAEADLILLQTQYGEMVTAIAAAAAGSDDQALALAKAQADLLVAEFLALKTVATAKKAALAALD